MSFPPQGTATAAGSLLHDSLGGLPGADPHTQYILAAGRSGGQAVIGGTAPGDTLTLRATSDAAGGDVLITADGGEDLRWIASTVGGFLKATARTNGERAIRVNSGSGVNQATLLFTRQDAFKFAIGHGNASALITGAAVGPQVRSFTAETWSFALDGADAVDMTWAVSADVLTISTGASMAMELKALTTLDLFGGGTRQLRVNATGVALYSGTPVAQAAAPTALTGGTADLTYDATERDMLNNHETILGEIVAALRATTGIGVTA